jgi:hypothetical protein
MSSYYKYNFISPESTYSIVKEELKGYFDTGACDDLLFPSYVNECLRRLGRGSYVIKPEMMYLEDFQARLPDNFHAVREAWLCAEVDAAPYQAANSFYSQSSSTTIQIAPMTVGGDLCNNPTCTNPNCDGTCQPEIIQAVYKTNHEVARTYHKEYLLKPGNISARKNCDVSYTDEWDLYDNCQLSNSLSTGSSGYDSFDIRDNKFVTNFRTGSVYLIYYAVDYDETGNQLIPDNYYIRKFIELFLKYKMFETLTNQTNDETFNQLQQKMENAKMMADEAFISATTETKKETIYDKQRKIRNTLRRFNMYELPNRSRSAWRRN